jgi:hypothetical protein
MAYRNEFKNWGMRPLRGLRERAPDALADPDLGRDSRPEQDRREDRDRRSRHWWSVFYGSFNPRRRRPPRRLRDTNYHSIDWHASHLLAVAIVILLLSVSDAGLTLVLLEAGAEEANPVMALVVGGDAMLFAALKMAMTGVSVILMVYLARYRFLRRVRVEIALYGILVFYSGLIGYELWMIHAHGLSLPF